VFLFQLGCAKIGMTGKGVPCTPRSLAPSQSVPIPTWLRQDLSPRLTHLLQSITTTAPLTRLIANYRILRNGANNRVRHVQDADNTSFEATERAPKTHPMSLGDHYD
jgi:hypothetical protein